jgi:hypothetical protein
MKKVLIISPNFPPVNAADMHRVRQSLPYFAEMGWEATVIAVEPRFVEMGLDENLMHTIPADANVIRLKAFNTRYTRKAGLGNLGLRALWHLQRWGRQNLQKGSFDLVYFSTTAFPVMTLGRYWKKKFGIPFIVDMQDPWRNDFYLTVPRSERPPKFWLAYRLDKWLEAFTMKKAGGIISVSASYPEVLKQRYPVIKDIPSETIPFGGASIDFEVLGKLKIKNETFIPGDGNIHVVYIGRGGHDMAFALNSMFMALKKGLDREPLLYNRIRMHFIGTSYARDGLGIKTVEPVAAEHGVSHLVSEVTERLPYFEALQLLKQADMLFIPGSTDKQYTASKLYPYILANRPLMALFHIDSSVVGIMNETGAGEIVTFNDSSSTEQVSEVALSKFDGILRRLPFVPETSWKAFEPYTAREMTRRQTEFFNIVINLR